MELPVLVDVDGVLTDDFYEKCISIVNERFGTEYKVSEMYNDIRKIILEWDDKMEDICRSQGFCSDFKPKPHSQDWISQLRENHKVVFVTSPYKNSPTWGHDRIKWLEKHFDATRDDVVLCHDKRYVAGLTLIDDLPKNCFDWAKFHQRKATMITKPWNRRSYMIEESALVVFESENCIARRTRF